MWAAVSSSHLLPAPRLAPATPRVSCKRTRRQAGENTSRRHRQRHPCYHEEAAGFPKPKAELGAEVRVAAALIQGAHLLAEGAGRVHVCLLPP